MKCSQSQRHDTLDRQFTVVEQVFKTAQGHFCANLFPHSDQTNSQHSSTLVFCVFCKVFCTLVQHFLDFENISAASVCTRLQHDNGILGDLVLDSTKGLNHGFCLFGLAQEQECKTQTEVSRMRMVKFGIGCFHETLHNGTTRDIIALAHVDHSKGQASQRHFHHSGRRGASRAFNDRHQNFHDIFAPTSSVGNTEASDCRALERVRVTFDMFRQKRQCRVGFIAYATAEHSHGKRGASLNVVLRRVQELVNLGQPLFYIPQKNASQGRSRSHHTMIFVLVEPFTVGRHELVMAKTSIDKRIDICAGQVGTGGIYLCASGISTTTEPSRFGKVRLVDIFGCFGIRDIQVLRQFQKLFR
mmetsp:Transcript_5036/g.9608  ORF Transcript_5036/g.9608 Transcript_5036/m.9608 type:complete len:358 (+) Transcript_5036:664-1737(+)